MKRWLTGAWGLGLLAVAWLLASGCAHRTPQAAPVRQRVFIIHGYGANPSSHWFPWLKQRLKAQGVPVAVIALPRSDAPDFDQWQATLHAAIGMPQANDIFIAHSLGTISTLHHLSAHKPARIGGLVLVSGFGSHLPQLPTINGYSVDAYIDRAQLDTAYLHTITPHIHHIISGNDPIVAPEESLKLAQQLGGAVTHVPRGGHFLAEDGFTQLPQAWQALAPLLKLNRLFNAKEAP